MNTNDEIMRVVRPWGFPLALVMAMAVAAGAQPRARRVVVTDFDAPSRQLADSGRAAVVNALINNATIVAANEWNDALERAPGHGPDRWDEASRDTNVVAVVEGWVQPEGKDYVLTIAIRDASNGAEMTHITIDLTASGTVAPAKAQKLERQLHDELSGLRPRPLPREEPRERVSKREEPRHERIEIEKPPPEEQEPKTPTSTPRFQASAGPYIALRTLTFGRDRGAPGELPIYPGHTGGGFAMHVAGFPWPQEKQSPAMSGAGATVDIDRSLFSTTATGGYTLRQINWEGAAHFRQPISTIVLDGDVNFGNVRYTLVNRPEGLMIPHASYAYLGGGGRIDGVLSDEVMLGGGIHYMYLRDVGEMASNEFYGSGRAWGLLFDASAIYKIDKSWFVRGAIEWRRVEIDYEGTGKAQLDMTDPMPIAAVVDGCVRVAVNIGGSY